MLSSLGRHLDTMVIRKLLEIVVIGTQKQTYIVFFATALCSPTLKEADKGTFVPTLGALFHILIDLTVK